MLWEKMKLLLLFLCAHRMHTTKATTKVTATAQQQIEMKTIYLALFFWVSGARAKGQRKIKMPR